MDSDSIENRHLEKQLFIDSEVIDFDKKISIVFNKQINIGQLFFKEMILNHLETKIDLNTIRFLVLRIKELHCKTLNVVYNTSRLNPDTDIVMYKTCCYPEHYHFESKMMFPLEKELHTRDLTIEVLDDKGNLLSKNELGNFFLDVKVVITNFILK